MTPRDADLLSGSPCPLCYGGTLQRVVDHFGVRCTSCGVEPALTHALLDDLDAKELRELERMRDPERQPKGQRAIFIPTGKQYQHACLGVAAWLGGKRL